MYGWPGAAVDDANLVVSEIVTNAVQANCQEIGLAIEAHHNHVTIAATDDAPGSPTRRRPRSDSVRGRGLLIVDALTDRWGVRDADGGRKTVWAELPVPSTAVPTFDCAG
jgi:anti-sigma regulatory factor (Ser/Thr protein kinase)